MKYYIIAGEASGDLHGSNLIKELKKIDAGAEFRCWGGDLMEQAGGELVRHYKDLAFMGFVEVVRNLPTIFKNLRFCKEDILSYRPDALILVDYPGFNLRIAKWARGVFPGRQNPQASKQPPQRSKQSPPQGSNQPPQHAQPPSPPQDPAIIYYISPQVWAWKENRVALIRACVDKMLVILPFEKEFYRKWNYEVEYVGHPLVDVVESYKLQAASSRPNDTIPPDPLLLATAGPNPDPRPVIALLPGSRKQEILKKLPVMLEVSRYFPDHQFIVAKAPGLENDFYRQLLENYPNVSAVVNQTYPLLLQARAACVTSGTATLETALFGVPEIVCYKGHALSFQIAKRLVKVKYISLVNLIMDKEVVKELIQDDLTPENLRRELDGLLHDPQRRQRLRDDYAALKDLLSQGGHASAHAAASIVKFLKE